CLHAAAAAGAHEPHGAVYVSQVELAVHVLDDHVAVVDCADLDRRSARHAHFDVVFDAVVVPTPTAASTAVIVVVADVPDAERDAAGLALGAQLHLRAGALDVRLQVAAHG